MLRELVLCCTLVTVAQACAAEPTRLPATGVAARRSLDLKVDPPEPLAPGPIAGRAPQATSLADLEQMALEGNPSIAKAQANIAAAQGNWIQVGLPPNPSSGYQGQQIGSRGLAEQDGAYVEQEFVRGGKLRLNREVAARQIMRLEQELAAQRQRVLNDVAIAYYGVLIAQRQQQLTAELLAVAEKNLAAAETLFKARQVGRVDVNQATIELENASIASQNARNRLTASWQSLGTVIGQTPFAPRQLSGDVELDHNPIELDAARERLLSASPEVAASVASIEQARASLQRARVEAVPNVTVQGLVNWRDNGIGGSSDGAIMVGLPIPAWNRNQGGIQQAQYHVVAAERGLQQLELELQNRLAPVYERYANAQNQVARYRQRILPAAKETLELTRKLYEGSEIDYITLLTAQRTFSQTNLNYLDALRELRVAEIELEGMLLRGSLEAR